MARPIEPTPNLEAEDAERLLRDLEQVCLPAEAERRMRWAEQQVAQMMGSKSSPSGGRPTGR